MLSTESQSATADATSESLARRILRRRSKYEVATATLLLFLLPSLAIIWNIEQRSRRILFESLKGDLISSAQVMATTVDPAIHATFHDRAQEQTDSYQQQIARFTRLRPAVDPNRMIKFIYTCVKKGDVIHFILDDTPEGDADHDGVDDKSHIMEPYTEAPDTLKQVFIDHLPKVSATPYTDKWGTFLSGYAPVYDTGHKLVAVVGVDIAMTEYDLELSSLKMVAWLGVIGAFSIAMLAAVVMGKYHSVLMSAMDRLMLMTKAVTAASRAKSDLLATMSHELRTPLNAITGHAAILADSVQGEQKASLDQIQNAANSLLGMISDILDYAAMDTGSLPIRVKPVRVLTLMTQVCDKFALEAQNKKLSLTITEGFQTPSRLMLDPTHAGQILRHLVSNAIKFTSAGEVQVEARSWSDGKLHIVVSDTGSGISEKKRQRLYEIFDQQDMSTTRQHGGAGLGLALCKRLCDAMRGRIWLEKTSSAGSEFHIEIPADAAPEPGKIWLLTKNNMTTIIVRSLAEKMKRELKVEEEARDICANDSDLVLVDLGSASPEGLQAKRVVALNAEHGMPQGSFADVLTVPLKPADLRRVLEADQ